MVWGWSFANFMNMIVKRKENNSPQEKINKLHILNALEKILLKRGRYQTLMTKSGHCSSQ
jgi:hypothetical protein